MDFTPKKNKTHMNGEEKKRLKKTASHQTYPIDAMEFKCRLLVEPVVRTA